MKKNVKISSIIILCISIIAILIYHYYPLLLFKITTLQREFNSQITYSLHSINANSQQAGIILLIISFLYGVFHSVGPGHGKFVLTSYLAISPAKIAKAIRITLLAALVQGLVAILLVSILIVLFTLSKSYFNSTLLWIERAGYCTVIGFGFYWLFNAWQKIKQSHKKNKSPLTIKKIQIIDATTPLIWSNQRHQSNVNCGCHCGHNHLPSTTQLDNTHNWKEQAMVIFSMGSRPCSGAILVLFLSYTLDLYPWGVISALAMAFGTGMTLSLLALIVIYMRKHTLIFSQGILPNYITKYISLGGKILVGILLIILGITLLHVTFVETSSSLFKR